MEPSPQPPRRSCRWLQFSLSNLLLVTLLAAALLAWQRKRISRWVESFWIVPAEAATDDFNPWPMVTIQVMIAEVALDGTDESGVERELQNSVLFDRNAADQSLPTELGFGGVVLTANHDRVIGELRKRHRLTVLSRPQILTMTNQRVSVETGQRTPSVQPAATGPQTNSPSAVLSVTPNVSDDGRMTMEMDVESSEVGPEGEGIPVSVLATGEVIRSPRVNTTTAQTTVRALSGQTIVFGGLVTKSNSGQKAELVIILTPRVIWNEHEGGETR